MQHNRQLACDRDDCLLHAAPASYCDAPGLQRTPPAARAGEEDKCDLVERGAQHRVTALRDSPGPGCLTGLVETRRQSVMGSDTFGATKPSRIVDAGAI